ncbi:LuxR family transcriptional regulator [Pseudomonas aeruginosa]|nr:LuxR family transcriptional regulator [Pseudomonas aeruginosa]
MWISHCTAAPGTSHWESCSKRWTGRSSGGSWRRPSASSPPVDNWAALIFSDSSPLILSFMEEEREEVEPDPLISRYITGLYLQDPFYQVSRNCRRGGLFHLADIVSEDFETTEYYNTYFAHYVVTDEVQYNVPLDGERTLCLSLGSESRFGAEQIALFELLRPWVIALMKKRIHFEDAVREEAKTDRSGGGGSPALERVDIAADRAGVGCHPPDAGWILEQGNSGSADAVDRHHQGASPAHLREAEREVPLRDIRAIDQPARAAARRRTLVRRLRRNPGA